MANTTEGEWRASRHCVYAGDKMIATGCILDVKDHDERSANLHLMAAAPDLLDACKQMLHALDNKDELELANGKISALDAIRKATSNTL